MNRNRNFSGGVSLLEEPGFLEQMAIRLEEEELHKINFAPTLRAISRRQTILEGRESESSQEIEFSDDGMMFEFEMDLRPEEELDNVAASPNSSVSAISVSSAISTSSAQPSPQGSRGNA